MNHHQSSHAVPNQPISLMNDDVLARMPARLISQCYRLLNDENPNGGPHSSYLFYTPLHLPDAFLPWPSPIEIGNILEEQQSLPQYASCRTLLIFTFNPTKETGYAGGLAINEPYPLSPERTLTRYVFEAENCPKARAIDGFLQGGVLIAVWLPEQDYSRETPIEDCLIRRLWLGTPPDQQRKSYAHNETRRLQPL